MTDDTFDLRLRSELARLSDAVPLEAPPDELHPVRPVTRARQRFSFAAAGVALLVVGLALALLRPSVFAPGSSRPKETPSGPAAWNAVISIPSSSTPVSAERALAIAWEQERSGSGFLDSINFVADYTDSHGSHHPAWRVKFRDYSPPTMVACPPSVPCPGAGYRSWAYWIIDAGTGAIVAAAAADPLFEARPATISVAPPVTGSEAVTSARAGLGDQPAALRSLTLYDDLVVMDGTHRQVWRIVFESTRPIDSSGLGSSVHPGGSAIGVCEYLPDWATGVLPSAGPSSTELWTAIVLVDAVTGQLLGGLSGAWITPCPTP